MRKMPLALFLFFCCPALHATTLRWTFTDATFFDGTSIAGSFVLDTTSSNTNNWLISAFDITTTAQGEFTGTHYTAANGAIATVGDTNRISFAFLFPNVIQLGLILQNNLKLGGIDPITIGDPQSPANTSREFLLTAPFDTRLFATGSLVASPLVSTVAEPGTASLLLVGMAALIFPWNLRRRRPRRA